MRRSIIAIACLGLLSATAFTTSPALRRTLGLEGSFTEPTAAYRLIAAQPYVLERSYVSYDRKEQPRVDCGWILALKVPAELAQVRNGLMPVLCVGDTTAERWNSGEESGQIVVTVPSARNSNGLPALDLGSASVWFAKPELTERVDANWIATARAEADANVLTPFDAALIEGARSRGGELLRLRDHNALGLAVSDWILEYAPEEREFAESLR